MNYPETGCLFDTKELKVTHVTHREFLNQSRQIDKTLFDLYADSLFSLQTQYHSMPIFGHRWHTFR